MEDCICETCGGDGVLLGTLGNLTHFRCRQCGADFSRAAQSEPDEYISVLSSGFRDEDFPDCDCEDCQE